jgi:uncharacterized protein (DUF1800 family)
MALTRAQAQKASLVFQRFGLGAKPKALARIAPDPKAALIAEVKKPRVALIVDDALPSYAEACQEGIAPYPRPDTVRAKEFDARLAKHMAADIGFVERLVIFWSNHFSMSFHKALIIRATIGQLERDVIRANALGKFGDMLAGVMRHPAMIKYLDNEESIGEESVVGFKRRVSYTENLAREMLELHTLGPGNYEESDVKALAKMLTGWSYVRPNEAANGVNGGTPQNGGQFIFRSDWHQQGPQTFLGRKIPEGGVEQAETAFAMLAAHPATARKIAKKLLLHFVTDEPSDDMIAPIAQAYTDSDGDLKQVALALIELPEAWSAPMTKIRTPYEFLMAQFRALGTLFTKEEAGSLMKILESLNHAAWDAPSPEGYPDDTLYWLTPNALSFRLDAAQLVARVIGRRVKVDPVTLARSLYGASMTAPTRERIGGAGSQLAALTILFVSPEFQRR